MGMSDSMAVDESLKTNVMGAKVIRGMFEEMTIMPH